jgi:hypothetical protein
MMVVHMIGGMIIFILIFAAITLIIGLFGREKKE